MDKDIAKLRTPTEEELSRIRELWRRCGHAESSPSSDVGLELNHYMNYSLRFIGTLAGLHPVTGEPILPQAYPLRVSELGVQRLHERVRLCSAVMALWIPAE